MVIINKAGAGHMQSETGDSRIQGEDCQTCTLFSLVLNVITVLEILCIVLEALLGISCNM